MRSRPAPQASHVANTSLPPPTRTPAAASVMQNGSSSSSTHDAHASPWQRSKAAQQQQRQQQQQQQVTTAATHVRVCAASDTLVQWQRPFQPVLFREWYIYHYCSEAHVRRLDALQRLGRARSPRLQRLLTAYLQVWSMTGEAEFYTLTLPTLVWLGRPVDGIVICSMLWLGQYVTGTIKDAICCPRPPCPPLQLRGKRLTHDTEYGFPSTHSCQSGVYAYFLYCQLVQLAPTHAPLCWLAAVLFFAHVSFSRVYLGMHWFGDLVGGWLVALVCILVHVAFVDRWLLQLLQLREAPWWAFVALYAAVHAAAVLHAVPHDPCPCYIDSLRFTGAFAGGIAGVWLFARRYDALSARTCPVDTTTGIVHARAAAAATATMTSYNKNNNNNDEAAAAAAAAACWAVAFTWSFCVQWLLCLLVVVVGREATSYASGKLLYHVFYVCSGACAEQMPALLRRPYLALARLLRYTTTHNERGVRTFQPITANNSFPFMWGGEVGETAAHTRTRARQAGRHPTHDDNGGDNAKQHNDVAHNDDDDDDGRHDTTTTAAAVRVAMPGKDATTRARHNDDDGDNNNNNDTNLAASLIRAKVAHLNNALYDVTGTLPLPLPPMAQQQAYANHGTHADTLHGSDVRNGDAAAADVCTELPRRADDAVIEEPDGYLTATQVWSLRTHTHWWLWDAHRRTLAYFVTGLLCTYVCPMLLRELFGVGVVATAAAAATPPTTTMTTTSVSTYM